MGFDTVVPIEDVLLFDEKMEPVGLGAKIIKLVKAPSKMQFVRACGSDIKLGETILQEG